jgi:anti-sigma factor RsiW
MIDCPNGDIRDLLPDLLHGRLDADDRARVERHVATCEACTEELALLGDLRSTIRRAPAVDVAAIAAAIPAYRAPARTRTWGSWRAAAAVAAIAVGGTSIALLGRESERAGSAPPVAIATDVESVAVAPAAPKVVRESASAAGPGEVAVATKSTNVPAAPAVAAPVALAMTGRAIGDLSDHELSTLLDEIESLDALPSEEVESGSAIDGSIPLETSR